MAGTNFTSSASGNWSDPTKWTGGTGSNYPGQDAADTATIAAGHTITLDGDYTLASVTINSTNGVLAVAATHSLTVTANPGVEYKGTQTTGGITVAAGATLTITGPSSGVTLLCSGSGGYGVVNATTGGITINAGGSGTGTAVSITATNAQGIRMSGTGVMVVNGDGIISSAGTGAVLYYHGSNATTSTVTGDITLAGSGEWGLRVTGGKVVCNGQPLMSLAAGASGPAWSLAVSGGELDWVGTHTISGDVSVFASGGTFGFGTASTALAVTLSGRICIVSVTGCTITEDYSTITLSSASAQAAIVGSAETVDITGPIIPAVGLVALDEEYGYAGDPATGTRIDCPVAQAQRTGTPYYGNPASLVDGTLYGPNLDSDPGVTTADAVISTAHFGVANATVGTAAGGGNVIVIDD